MNSLLLSKCLLTTRSQKTGLYLSRHTTPNPRMPCLRPVAQCTGTKLAKQSPRRELSCHESAIRLPGMSVPALQSSARQPLQQQSAFCRLESSTVGDFCAEHAQIPEEEPYVRNTSYGYQVCDVPDRTVTTDRGRHRRRLAQAYALFRFACRSVIDPLTFPGTSYSVRFIVFLSFLFHHS